MSQDNIQTDTPQESSNEQQYASLEEAVFGGGTEGSDADVTSAFTTGNEDNTETASTEGQVPIAEQPQVSTQETTQEPNQLSNDENRYQYWQSQADKYKNELESLKGQ